jgi:hypothetical protein
MRTRIFLLSALAAVAPDWPQQRMIAPHTRREARSG